MPDGQTISITDSTTDENMYSASFGHLGCRSDVTHRAGTDPQGSELYRTNGVVIQPGQKSIVFTSKETHVATQSGTPNTYDLTTTTYTLKGDKVAITEKISQNNAPI